LQPHRVWHRGISSSIVVRRRKNLPMPMFVSAVREKMAATNSNLIFNYVILTILILIYSILFWSVRCFLPKAFIPHLIRSLLRSSSAIGVVSSLVFCSKAQNKKAQTLESKLRVEVLICFKLLNFTTDQPYYLRFRNYSLRQHRKRFLPEKNRLLF